LEKEDNMALTKELIVVGIPTVDPSKLEGRWHPRFALFLRNLVIPSGFTVRFITKWNGSLPDARESIMKRALELGARYLFLLDDNVLAPVQVLDHFLATLLTTKQSAAITTTLNNYSCVLFNMDCVGKLQEPWLNNDLLYSRIDRATDGFVFIDDKVVCELVNETVKEKEEKPLVDVIKPRQVTIPEPVTIVIPCWKADSQLLKCLAAIYQNTDYPFKLVIVGNNLDEDSYKTLNGFPNIQVIVNDESFGWATSINQGIEVSKTNLICLLSCGAVVSKGWLSKLVCELVQDVGAVVPTTNNFSGLQNVLRNTGNMLPEETDLVSCVCLLTTKQVLSAVGLMDESFSMLSSGDDFDFMLRLGRAGYKKLIVREVFVPTTNGYDNKGSVAYRRNQKAWVKSGINSLLRKHGQDVVKEFLPSLNLEVE